jgi:hypothetical protein
MKKTINKTIDKIKNLYWSTIPYDYRPHELWYKTKCLLWKRYKIVNPRYLPYTWTDKDNLLAHAMFEILSKFLEKECSPSIVDWYSEDIPHKINIEGRNRHVIDVMWELYTWWHQIYNKYYVKIEDELYALQGEHSPSLSECFFDDEDREGYKFFDMRQAFNKNNCLTKDDEKIYYRLVDSMRTFEYFTYEELQEKLHTIIEVRRYMWT